MPELHSFVDRLILVALVRLVKAVLNALKILIQTIYYHISTLSQSHDHVTDLITTAIVH